MTKPARRYHVVHTNARAESLANSVLRANGFDTLYLYYRGKTNHARKVREVIRPYFPRYIFVGLEPSQALHGVNTALGVATVLYCGEEPLRVPEAVMRELKGRANDDGEVLGMETAERQLRRRMGVGEKVRIDGGPFHGFIGQVVIDTGREVRLWIEELSRFAGKPVRVDLPPEALSPNLRSYV